MQWLTPILVVQAASTWVLCLIISCLFFDRNGEPKLEPYTFKAVLTAIYSSIGALIFRYVLCSLPLPPGEKLSPHASRIGLLFVFVNVVLDILIFIPMVNSQQRSRPNPEFLTVRKWFCTIGIGYVSIFAQAWLAGQVADWAVAEQVSA